MCGICGIVDFTGRPVTPDAVIQMRDVMIRRGPDSAGLKVLPNFGLGHRRLSIIDLAETGDQPMANEDESLWVVLNGEIYGFQALRSELMRAGHRFRSTSDTEVLLHGYEEYGPEALLLRLNGMFAFAIWDASKQMLFVARDRLGKKPLYYGAFNDRVYFASDVKSLWLASGRSLSIADDAIARFLYWGYIPGPQTIFKEVRQLMPGSYARITAGSVEERPYWNLSFAFKLRLSPNDAIDAVDAELREAVRRRLYSEVPLGAFLSGGVDSSLVVHYMSELMSEPVRTFCIGFDSFQHDERMHALSVARHCGTRHTEDMLHADVQATLPLLVWEYGQPFGDAAAISTSYLAQAARKQVTVALTGDGGDESFAGYSQHQASVLVALVRRFVPGSVIDSYARNAQKSYARGNSGHLSSFERFIRYASRDPLLSLSSVDFWNGTQLGQLRPHGEDGARSPEHLLAPALNRLSKFDGANALDRALFFDLSMLLPFEYNVKLDVSSMFSSLETRCPFLDYKVVELAAALPWNHKLRPWERKHILKRLAVRYLPRHVIYRPKHGFSLPMDEWMAGAWAPIVEGVVFGPEARRRALFDYRYLRGLWERHLAGRERHGHRFWALLWLELWFELVIDGTMAVGDPYRKVRPGFVRNG